MPLLNYLDFTYKSEPIINNMENKENNNELIGFNSAETIKFDYDSNNNDNFCKKCMRMIHDHGLSTAKLLLCECQKEDNTKINLMEYGWVCPLCNMVYSPTIHSCNCSVKTKSFTNLNTNIHYGTINSPYNPSNPNNTYIGL